MRKLARTDPGIDYVKLLAERSRRLGIAKYTLEAIEAFGGDVQQSLTESALAEHRIRGLRTEYLFIAYSARPGRRFRADAGARSDARQIGA